MRSRLCAALGVVLTLAWAGCGEGSSVSARQATSRAQLVGGERALGDIGDYVLENERIRVVVQGPGYSRGFGVYGGSLIDADRRRPFVPALPLGRHAGHPADGGRAAQVACVRA